MDPNAKAARRAFWIAILFGTLTLLSAFYSLLPGLITASILFFIAFRLRAGSAGAALALLGFFVLPLVTLLPRIAQLNVAGAAMMAAIHVVAAVFAGLALRELWSRRRNLLPWVSAGVPYVLLLVGCQAFVMPSDSMAGTLLPGDRVLVEKGTWQLGRLPKRGDLVTFAYPVDPKQTFMKRVIGVPGDRVRIEHKQVFLNGARLEEPYALHTTSYEDSYRDNFPSEPNTPVKPSQLEMLRQARAGEVIVPEGQYFVLGDNRDNSLDSRYWGFVKRADIIGSPVVIYDSHEGGETIADTRWNRLLKRP